eukprot:gene12705-17037_t
MTEYDECYCKPSYLWMNSSGDNLYFVDMVDNNCSCLASKSESNKLLVKFVKLDQKSAHLKLSSSIQFESLGSISGDTMGFIYVLDQGRVRKFNSEGNEVIVSTMISVTSQYPQSLSHGWDTHSNAIAVSNEGDIFYYSGGYHVKKIDSAGIIAIFAGNGSLATIETYGDNRPAVLATVMSVSGICIDIHGVVYISDFDIGTIRMIQLTGIITTIVGIPFSSIRNGVESAHVASSSHATSTVLFSPSGLFVDSSAEYLYIAEQGAMVYNANNGIKRVYLRTGMVDVISGHHEVANFESNLLNSHSESLIIRTFGIGGDQNGNIYVTQQVIECDNDGTRQISLKSHVARSLVVSLPACNATVVIPDGITTISSSQYAGCSSMTSLVISSSVKTIGSYAFRYCVSLITVTIPDSVTAIGDYAFEQCSSLASIRFGSGLTRIGTYAFHQTKLSSLVIPNEVISIGSYAFGRCLRLKSISIGTGLTSLSMGIFLESAISNITIPNQITSIGKRAFMWCIYLTNVTFGSNLVSISDQAFRYSGLTSISFPNSLISIGGYAFQLCPLQSVTFGSGLTSIGSFAFSYTYLHTISFPNSLTSIGEYAFYDTKTLSSVTLGTGIHSSRIRSNAFAGSSISCLFSSTGSSVTISGTSVAFLETDCDGQPSGCGACFNDSRYIFNKAELNGIVAPNMRKSDDIYKQSILQNQNSDAALLGDEDSKEKEASLVYRQMVALPSCNVTVIIPSGITAISASAYSQCYSLKSLTIANTVTSIGNNAFRYCVSLITVTIPDSVTAIGDYAFEQCSSLASIRFGSGLTRIGTYAFHQTKLSSLVIPNEVISIGSYAFGRCLRLKSISIGTGLTSLSMGIFLESAISNITIPNQITSIGKRAFMWCIYLTNVTFGSNLVSISDQAFRYSGLTSISFPNSLISIGGYAFQLCPLQSVTFGSGLTSIGSFAFSYTYLHTISFPNSLTSIGEYAFYDTKTLSSVTLGTGIHSSRIQSNYCTGGCIIFTLLPTATPSSIPSSSPTTKP